MLNFFKHKSYHQVTTFQLFLMAIVTGVISASVVMINNHAMEYLQLPIVQQDASGSCVNVLSFRNGEVYTCQDVDMILRKYRTKKVESNDGDSNVQMHEVQTD